MKKLAFNDKVTFTFNGKAYKYTVEDTYLRGPRDYDNDKIFKVLGINNDRMFAMATEAYGYKVTGGNWPSFHSKDYKAAARLVDSINELIASKEGCIYKRGDMVAFTVNGKNVRKVHNYVVSSTHLRSISGNNRDIFEALGVTEAAGEICEEEYGYYPKACGDSVRGFPEYSSDDMKAANNIIARLQSLCASYGTLSEGDLVKFTTPERTITYSVWDGFLNNEDGIAGNREIFELLGIDDPVEFCNNAYGYMPVRGSSSDCFPEYKAGDMAAASLIINALHQECKNYSEDVAMADIADDDLLDDEYIPSSPAFRAGDWVVFDVKEKAMSAGMITSLWTGRLIGKILSVSDDILHFKYNDMLLCSGKPYDELCPHVNGTVRTCSNDAVCFRYATNGEIADAKFLRYLALSEEAVKRYPSGIMTPSGELSHVIHDVVSCISEGKIVFRTADDIFVAFRNDEWSSVPIGIPVVPPTHLMGFDPIHKFAVGDRVKFVDDDTAGYLTDYDHDELKDYMVHGNPSIDHEKYKHLHARVVAVIPLSDHIVIYVVSYDGQGGKMCLGFHEEMLISATGSSTYSGRFDKVDDDIKLPVAIK